MPECDLCGRETDLVRAEIEGTELSVCVNCGKHGVVLGKAEKERPKVFLPKKKVMRAEEPEEIVVSSFSGRLKRAREKKGMNQEEFATLLNEKWSVVQKWENGSLSPRLEVAKRIGRLLNISLVEKVNEEEVKLEKGNSGEVTLGDMIKIRKR